jgi:hypothetical protein
MRSVHFNGIALGELSVNFLEGAPKLVAKGAFINTQTGQTHGWTTCQQWSTDTMEKMKELRLLMERDMSAQHFVDGSVSTTVTTTTGGGGLKDGFQGLGEKFGATDEDVPQVPRTG